MSNYLIELSIIHIVLVLGYWFFLRKERQYAKMRFYLIGATLLALTIPLVKLPNLLFSSKEPIAAITAQAISFEGMIISPSGNESIWSTQLLIWSYLAMSVLFLLKSLSNVGYLIYLERQSGYEKFKGLYIRKVQNIKGSFTFFNWIFLSAEIDKKQTNYEVIVNHEKAHASLGHTYDLLFFELFKACFWWLPTVWFINKEIKKIHEYQADACALKSHTIDQYSSILISSTLKINGLSLASSFHDGLILKRLEAMKKNAKKMSPWKLGGLSSLGMVLFLGFACSENPNQEMKEIVDKNNTLESAAKSETFTIVEDQPTYPGGTEALYAYMAKQLKYPEQARKLGVEGKVLVGFVVERDGSISDVKALEGIGAGCDREAERVVSGIPKFDPGSQRGRKVRVQMKIPILFKLSDGEASKTGNSKESLSVDEINFKADASYANGEWAGTIYDENGKAMPGANIVVDQTVNGTVSDLDGTFKLKAQESQDIIVSFVGYQSVRIKGK